MTNNHACLSCGDDMPEVTGPQVCLRCQSRPCVIIFDHDTGTVLDAESCSIVITTDADAALLSDGQLDAESWTPIWGRPVITDAIRFRVNMEREDREGVVSS